MNNLSEEEKKAIEFLNNMIKHKPDTIRLEWRRGIYALQLILNLIEKQQKEISLLKDQLEYVKSEDVAQEDLRRIIKLIDVKEKGLKQVNKIITEQDNQITELNNKNYNLEFIIASQQKEIGELQDTIKYYKEQI